MATVKYVAVWDNSTPEKDLQTKDQYAQEGKQTAYRQKSPSNGNFRTLREGEDESDERKPKAWPGE